MEILALVLTILPVGWIIFIIVRIRQTHRTFIKRLKQFPDLYNEYETESERHWKSRAYLFFDENPFLFVHTKFEEVQLKEAVEKHDETLLLGIKSFLPVIVLMLLAEWIRSLA